MAPTLLALVIGVGPGTGAAVARRFAASYPVVCMARTAASYAGVVDAINASGGRALGVATDVADERSVAAAMDAVAREFGRDAAVAAAVFNASGRFARKPFLELTEEDFMAGLDVSA